MTPFLIALQFLTTFPIQLKAMPSPQQNAQSLLFYPIIGLLIGLILFATAYFLNTLPIILLSTLILVLWIWLTGGLHLDGLADTADAWVGGFGDKERTLSIMKDPACGPIGVLSLIILCLIKWSALYVLLDKKLYLALILFPILGRLAPLFLFLTTEYVRAKGLGSSIAQYIPKTWAMIVFALMLLATGYFVWTGLATAIIFILTLIYLRHKFVQRIDGITGDTVGASIEIVEAVSLLSFVVLSFYL
ncbi:adenosylcobinamide-GDP ribazoletransferase [Acinetobacter wuhouensis]|uniref:Adenosylcobinamide-GDP ribazoletransferase n=1 Tax=Acinetobacter wuhouensis TaxID=1879050 RepID=A0A4Q7ALT3_9GAMM|nr:adenosylcobinamide-GDP ribazoletransferase [Acinetobacter wuhouensis]RZG47951.1 adenosylcobinamide-GDP ribazoletransferase [Acinetobacter wuhouensis]RZG75478.1 adenosylcobinamide-GDP ribazoletransferase [Acinetobacter wuhouensis]